MDLIPPTNGASPTVKLENPTALPPIYKYSSHTDYQKYDNSYYLNASKPEFRFAVCFADNTFSATIINQETQCSI